MNNKKSLKVLLMTIIMTLLSTSIVFAAEVDTATSNANHYGLLTLIPPVVAIVLAFLTKNVIISLFIGTLSGTFLVQLVDNSFLSAIVQSFLDFVSRILNSLADPWNAGIILQVLVIGGVIHLVAKMGGAKAVAEALARKAKTAKSTQVVTLLLGLAVFFDDYANSLIVGPIMKPVADKMKISRERLAFIIDATAAPIAGLAIVSTWIGLEVGLINDAFINGIGQEVDAFGVFLQTIPYRFYNILILVFVFITSILLKEFGPMYKAEVEARRRGLSFEEEEVASDSNMDHDELEPKEGIKLSIWNAIIPIGVLVITALLCFYFSGYSAIMGGEDVALQGIMTNSPLSFKAIQEAFSASDASVALFQSALVASIVAIIMGVAKKIFTVSEAIDTWIDGMKPLLITGVILLLAWSLSSVIKDLGTAKYLVSLLSGSLPNFLLPSLIFILGAIISFATGGTAYGTMGILMPLAIPLAYSMNPDMSYVIVSTSAVLTGAIFGDHCSPISDTTILSSMGAGCNHIAHVNTQMWYALFIAAITILFGYIPAGFGLQWYIVLPISIIAVFLGVQILGKKVEEAK